MKKDLRTSLKQKLDHLKITKNPRRDGQHPRILKVKADSIKKKPIEPNICNTLLTPREESAKDQKERLGESLRKHKEDKKPSKSFNVLIQK